MPRITNPTGIAINIRGFIRLSFFRLLDSLWILEEGGGQNREYVRCETGAEVHATFECGLAFYLLRAITALENAIT